MFGKVFEIVPHLVFPLYFMLIGLTYIPGTFGSLLLNGEFRILFSPSAFKDAVGVPPIASSSTFIPSLSDMSLGIP
jgi:hypothetical protein